MAKREPRWVGVFLRQLERTGNVRLAAEGAGVDFTTAYQRRKRHLDFAERWEGSLRAFGQGKHALTLPQPAAAPSLSRNGRGEMEIRPDGKLVRASEARWSPRKEERFLTALAETANVRHAAEAAGVSSQAVYARRLKHSSFAEAWETALDTGKAKLEAMLIEAAQRRFDPDTLPISDKDPQVSVGEAIHIVKLKRSEPGRGPANGGGREPRVATPEEAEQMLIKRLKQFATRVEKEDLANGWSMHEGRLIPPGWVRAEDGLCARCGGEVVGTPSTIGSSANGPPPPVGEEMG